MLTRFHFTIWITEKKTGAGFMAHCIELDCVFERPTLSKAYARAVYGVDEMLRQMMQNDIWEPELLLRGWVIIKSYYSIQVMHPGPERRIKELQHMFAEQGIIKTFNLEKDIPHPLEHGLGNLLTEAKNNE